MTAMTFLGEKNLDSTLIDLALAILEEETVIANQRAIERLRPIVTTTLSNYPDLDKIDLDDLIKNHLFIVQ